MAVEALDVSHWFDKRRALDRVSLSVGAGEIHAVIGRNAAGKTTLLRVLAGLVEPTKGTVRLGGRRPTDPRARGALGWLPSGDRTFYQRLTGVENLLFFARLGGLRRREAQAHIGHLLERLGLADAARRRVGLYSHGMQRRLAVARALLVRPAVVLVDEATHNLDPYATRLVLSLMREAAHDGAAVVWTTQRLEEIRGFADRVSVLGGGAMLFEGAVRELTELASADRFVIRCVVRRGENGPALLPRVRAALDGRATVSAAADGDVLLELERGVPLGAAVARLQAEGLDVVRCREWRSEVEDAFTRLTSTETPG